VDSGKGPAVLVQPSFIDESRQTGKKKSSVCREKRSGGDVAFWVHLRYLKKKERRIEVHTRNVPGGVIPSSGALYRRTMLAERDFTRFII